MHLRTQKLSLLSLNKATQSSPQTSLKQASNMSTVSSVCASMTRQSLLTQTLTTWQWKCSGTQRTTYVWTAYINSQTFIREYLVLRRLWSKPKEHMSYLRDYKENKDICLLQSRSLFENWKRQSKRRNLSPRDLRKRRLFLSNRVWLLLES